MSSSIAVIYHVYCPREICRHVKNDYFTIISVGGRRPRGGGGVDSRGSYVSKILYVEMKESGPLGEGARAPGTPPRSANVQCTK